MTGLASRADRRDVFVTNLRRLRNARELSQDDLAYEAEVSLSQLEKGAFYASLKIETWSPRICSSWRQNGEAAERPRPE
jgi:DNA-binding XRE family transcriptional regulator